MPAGLAGLATILALKSDITELAVGLNQGLELIKKFTDGVKSVIDGIVQAGQQALEALKRVAAGIAQLSGQAARLDSMRDSFNKLAASAGTSGQELLAAMNEATLGMAKDADLIQSSMTAMMLINQRALGDATETIPKLAQIATAAARALGEDVGYMFDSIARGIGRASPMILDNIGLTIKLGEVYGNYAKQLGKTTKELTVVEKQTALLNAVLGQYDNYVTKLGISTGGLATVQKQFQKVMLDLKDTIGQAFMPMVQALMGVQSDLANMVVDKLIPAFRTLGRVMSEVFGTKNPFWRWVEGDVVQKTTERIQGLYGSLMELQQLGPDFAGAVTAAVAEYNKGLKEIGEKARVQLEKIQEDLVERIADIWSDFRKSQARRDEDFQEQEDRRDADFQTEQRRRTATHLERMREIRKRYDDDIADAIRNRDARALLNLLKSQKKELNAEQSNYNKTRAQEEEERAKEKARAKADHEKERARALEDARERVAEARKSAKAQSDAIISERSKAADKLQKIKDKEVQAAVTAYEEEVAYLREQIAHQEKLREKQIEEVAKIREEMAKPLPPAFQVLKSILEVIWDRLRLIREIIRTLFTGEMPDAVTLRNIGIKYEDFERIINILNVFKKVIAGAFNFVIENLPKVISLINTVVGSAYAEYFEVFVEELLPEILALLKELLPLIKVMAIVLGVTVLSVLRALVKFTTAVTKNATIMFRNLTAIINGIKRMINGAVEFIVGLITWNLNLLTRGLRDFGGGALTFLSGLLDQIFYTLTAWIRVVLTTLDGFVGGVLRAFVGLKNDLVTHSVIPDMLTEMSDAFTTFFSSSRGVWEKGWGELADTANVALQGIVPTMSLENAISASTGAGGEAGSTNSTFQFGGVNVYGVGSPQQAGEEVYNALTKLFNTATAKAQSKRRR